MTDEYQQYEYTYSLYDLGYNDSEDSTGEYITDENGDVTYVEDYYDVTCNLGDMQLCYDIED